MRHRILGGSKEGYIAPSGSHPCPWQIVALQAGDHVDANINGVWTRGTVRGREHTDIIVVSDTDREWYRVYFADVECIGSHTRAATQPNETFEGVLLSGATIMRDSRSGRSDARW
jgi:hypothetical protein